MIWSRTENTIKILVIIYDLNWKYILFSIIEKINWIFNLRHFIIDRHLTKIPNSSHFELSAS